jgi:predicted SnoaL-like aldol condensation-catalyzing enzyme
MKPHERIVETFWHLFHEARFDEANQYLSPDCTIYWPNTQEVFRGRDKFISANKAYPGRWYIDIKTIFSKGDCVVSVVRVYSQDEKHSFHAISFFKFDDNIITEITEYYGEISKPPEWRIKENYSERY